MPKTALFGNVAILQHPHKFWRFVGIKVVEASQWACATGFGAVLM